MTLDYSNLTRQPINFRQINQILQKAYKTLGSAKKIIKDDPDVGFSTSYDSMLKTTLALMLSKGFRPKTKLGHHRTLVEYAQQVLGSQFAPLTATYNRMRQKRNKLLYDVNSVSDTEANQSVVTAEKYFWVIEDKIAKDNPQQKLWRP